MFKHLHISKKTGRGIPTIVNKYGGFANAQTMVDVNRNIQPSKLNSRLKRIDGTVATIIAYATLTRYKLGYENMTK